MLAFANRYRRRRRRRRARRRNRFYAMNRRSYRRRSRRYRRNPAALGLRGAMQFQNWLPLAFTGGFSAIATGVVPNFMNIVNPWVKLGVQVGTAFVGGEMIRRFVGRSHGVTWMIVGTSVIAVDLLRTWLPRFGVQIPLGAYEDYAPGTDQTGLLYGYPEQMQGVGAFTDQNLQGVGAYTDEQMDGIGMYPYPYGGMH